MERRRRGFNRTFMELKYNKMLYDEYKDPF